MFRTELRPQPSATKINLKSHVISVGSCFSEIIGEQLQQNKITTLVNPFGVIFNPISAYKLLSMALSEENPPEWSYLEHEGRWINYFLHSRINAATKEALKEKIQSLLIRIKEFLKNANFLMLTAGTAFVYTYKEENSIVANCHKQPQKLFTKELLSIEEIVLNFHVLYEKLQQINPALQFVLTVSPVRHTKDTLELNSVSKSILRLACHQVTEKFDNTFYFPSYELLMDDLRDYRFYDVDLIHPSRLAEQYVWQKFQDAFFDEETAQFVKTWESLQKAILHKPFNPSSEAHQRFLQKTIEKIKSLSLKVNMEEEIQLLEKQLI